MQTLRELDTAAASNRDRLALLVRLEHVARTVPAIGHTLVNQLLEQRAADEFGGTTLRELLANTLRISPTKAAERVHAAKELGRTTTLGGDHLEPRSPRPRPPNTTGTSTPRTWTRSASSCTNCPPPSTQAPAARPRPSSPSRP
ncbi:DUF222 domain-containing protein [Rhodococcus kronopolitis]|uniref:DUF222 domain-containing protein n=1 Tax=Rhodococcus kronopolitis TaxID=1460226 RepID=A0ABV9FMC0_9NOCA